MHSSIKRYVRIAASLLVLSACSKDAPVAPAVDSTPADGYQLTTSSGATQRIQLAVGGTTKLTVAKGPRSKVVQWTSSNPLVASVTSDGTVRGIKAGSATVAAAGVGGTGSVDVTVFEAARVASVSIVSAGLTVTAGGQIQFTAVARDSTSHVLTGRAVTWSIVGPTSSAIISATGLFTSISVGGATVRASVDGVSALASVLIVAPPAAPEAPTVTAFVVAPKFGIELAQGANMQFSSNALWNDGVTRTAATTYTATGGSVTVDGLYTAGQVAGAFMVIANCVCGRADTARLTITAAQLASLTIAPKIDSLAPGGTRQFSATASWSTGATTTPPLTYSASAGSITSTGMYTAPTTPGVYRVIVAHTGGTLRDTSLVTVSAPSDPQTPPPPTTPPATPPATGAVYSNGFDTGLFGLFLPWGGTGVAIVPDATANGGRSLQMTWVSTAGLGWDQDQGIEFIHRDSDRKLHIRFRYKQSDLANNGGIKKTVRFRGDINGDGYRAVGTFNIQWNCFLFYGDDFAIAPWNINQNGCGTSDPAFTANSPNTLRNRWRYLEMMLDYTEPGHQKAAMWVDGVQVINYDGILTTPMPSSAVLRRIWLASTFNSPGNARVEWYDDVVISRSYIGVP